MQLYTQTNTLPKYHLLCVCQQLSYIHDFINFSLVNHKLLDTCHMAKILPICRKNQYFNCFDLTMREATTLLNVFPRVDTIAFTHKNLLRMTPFIRNMLISMETWKTTKFCMFSPSFLNRLISVRLCTDIDPLATLSLPQLRSISFGFKRVAQLQTIITFINRHAYQLFDQHISIRYTSKHRLELARFTVFTNELNKCDFRVFINFILLSMDYSQVAEHFHQFVDSIKSHITCCVYYPHFPFPASVLTTAKAILLPSDMSSLSLHVENGFHIPCEFALNAEVFDRLVQLYYFGAVLLFPPVLNINQHLNLTATELHTIRFTDGNYPSLITFPASLQHFHSDSDCETTLLASNLAHLQLTEICTRCFCFQHLPQTVTCLSLDQVHKADELNISHVAQLQQVELQYCYCTRITLPRSVTNISLTFCQNMEIFQFSSLTALRELFISNQNNINLCDVPSTLTWFNNTGGNSRGRLNAPLLQKCQIEQPIDNVSIGECTLKYLELDKADLENQLNTGLLKFLLLTECTFPLLEQCTALETLLLRRVTMNLPQNLHTFTRLNELEMYKFSVIDRVKVRIPESMRVLVCDEVDGIDTIENLNESQLESVELINNDAVAEIRLPTTLKYLRLQNNAIVIGNRSELVFDNDGFEEMEEVDSTVESGERETDDVLMSE